MRTAKSPIRIIRGQMKTDRLVEEKTGTREMRKGGTAIRQLVGAVQGVKVKVRWLGYVQRRGGRRTWTEERAKKEDGRKKSRLVRNRNYLQST